MQLKSDLRLLVSDEIVAERAANALEVVNAFADQNADIWEGLSTDWLAMP